METKTQLDDTGAVCSPGKSPDRGVTLGTVAAFGPGFELRGRFPSGQRGQTVNLMAMPSQVRILFPPPTSTPLTPSRPAATPTRASRSAQAFGSRRACGRSSVVERQPSKLNAWVRFPSPAPAPSARLAPRGELFRRCCSSEVEHFLGKEEVMGSIPISSSSPRPLSPPARRPARP